MSAVRKAGSRMTDVNDRGGGRGNLQSKLSVTESLRLSRFFALIYLTSLAQHIFTQSC